MKETYIIPKDEIQNVRQIEVPKQLQLHNRCIPEKGHTLFEFNVVTRKVVKAEFEEVKDVPFEKKKRFKPITAKKVIMRENCIYISALNIKNCFKKLGL